MTLQRLSVFPLSLNSSVFWYQHIRGPQDVTTVENVWICQQRALWQTSSGIFEWPLFKNLLNSEAHHWNSSDVTTVILQLVTKDRHPPLFFFSFLLTVVLRVYKVFLKVCVWVKSVLHLELTETWTFKNTLYPQRTTVYRHIQDMYSILLSGSFEFPTHQCWIITEHRQRYTVDATVT